MGSLGAVTIVRSVGLAKKDGATALFWASASCKPEAGFLNIAELEINSRITRDSRVEISSRLANGFLSHKKLENKKY